ncbi:MAG TPA: type II toxin-antitoxin system VapC family toxin [Rhizomicrobium sp.]|jgi:predicted nucleic acid-binding protein|nr:type II toxin-antitoxin system VapC family toxin [Rhizomicrobium sp.]
MIVLDTNVISEPTRPRPSERVMQWLARHDAELYVTTISQAESHYGFVLLDPGQKRTELADAARQIYEIDFAGRVLSFDGDAARQFALIAAERKKARKELKILDAQIAAIARAHGAPVATRDVADFSHAGVKIIDPWTA